MPFSYIEQMLLLICMSSVSLQNFSIFTFLKANPSENGCSLTNRGGRLIVEIGSNGPCQIMVAVVGMNQESR